MEKTKEEIERRLCNITIELSDIYYENKHASVDMGGNRRRNLSEEWVFLSRKLDRMNGKHVCSCGDC